MSTLFIILNITCFSYAGHSNLVNAVAFSPNGSCIASAGDDGNIQVWDVTGRPISTIKEGLNLLYIM